MEGRHRDPRGALENVNEGGRSKGLTLIIPSRNEARDIARVVREWWGHRLVDAPMEILVVDDASDDASDRVLRELQIEIPIRVVRNAKRKGYGGSLRVGIRNARTPWVAFTDADGQYDPRDLAPLLEPLGDAVDVSVGVRVHRADSAVRRLISFGFRMLLIVAFGLKVRDPTGSLKAGRTEAFQWVAERTRYMNASFWSEFMVRSVEHGFSYAEVPIHHLPRLSGESKVVSRAQLLKVTTQQLIALFRLWREVNHGPTGQPATTSVSS